MRPPAASRALRSRLWRWLAVALCLLASYAYLERDPTLAAPPAVMALAPAHASHAALVAGVAAVPPPMAGMPMPDEAPPPSAQPDVHVGGPNAPPAPHDHRAHCPFCFTAAFSLTALDVALPALEAVCAARPLPAPVGALRRAVRHADARAPPA